MKFKCLKNAVSYNTCDNILKETYRLQNAITRFMKELEENEKKSPDYWMYPSKHRSLIKHRFIDFKQTVTEMIKEL